MLTNLQRQKIDQVFRYASPPERLTLSEWADKYRVLSAEFSAEAGKWNTARAEYQRGIMDAISSPKNEKIIIMSSSQVGKTEILLNTICYYIHLDPCPILFILPTKTFAEDFSKERLTPLFRDNKALRGLIKDNVAGGESSYLHKNFYGGYITLIGANNPINLASRPVKLILADEVDRYLTSAGDEGDPLELAIKRTVTYWDRKIVITSTPTLKNLSRIEQEYNKSSMGKYYVPCYNCGHYQILEFANVININDKVLYKCIKCNSYWDDMQRLKAIRHGKWIHEREDINIAGFHLNELYSTWTRLEEIYQRYLDALKYPEAMKVFVNTSLGLPYDEGENTVDFNLLNRKEEYEHYVPDGVYLITAGVDVQADRLEVDVTGWGLDEECWKIEYIRLYGDTQKNKVWQDLDDLLNKEYVKKDGTVLHIASMCIDSGHSTHQVYKFCKPREYRNVFAIKGASIQNAPIVSRPQANNSLKCKVFMVGTDTAKDLFFSRLKISEDGAGKIHFPIHFDEDYFNQLTAEKIVYIQEGLKKKRVYKKIRERNEALDCAIYAIASYVILSPNIHRIKARITAKQNQNIAKESEEMTKDNNNELIEIIRRKKQKIGKFKVHDW